MKDIIYYFMKQIQPEYPKKLGVEYNRMGDAISPTAIPLGMADLMPDPIPMAMADKYPSAIPMQMEDASPEPKI